MKIRCHCGHTIIDQSDDLADKAHLIPDQEWLRVLESLDSKVIDRVGDGTLTRESAYMESRRAIGQATRLIWQCRECGRLYVDDDQGELHCYQPATDTTHREILRSRPADRKN